MADRRHEWLLKTPELRRKATISRKRYRQFLAA
jgi:1,2-phenylacetyl-CoA epoxidase catalytic subunit